MGARPLILSVPLVRPGGANVRSHKMLLDTNQLRHGSVSLPFILTRPARLTVATSVPGAQRSCRKRVNQAH